MMHRKIAAKELAHFIGAITHPDRIRIIEEIQRDELDVSTLQDRLALAQACVSRHLGIMRSEGIVIERRDGRHVFYRLSVPELALWLIKGLDLISEKTENKAPLNKTFAAAKKRWGDAS